VYIRVICGKKNSCPETTDYADEKAPNKRARQGVDLAYTAWHSDGAGRGKRVYFCLRWETSTSLKGPWGEIGSAIIP
jgi:hypothetical protein